LSQKHKALSANKQYHEDADNDPYMQLGFGLMAYRNLLEGLILCFFFLTCLIYPVTQIYARGAGYQSRVEDHSPLCSKYMLGNLGYSSVQCQTASFGLAKIALQCPYGKIDQISDAGIEGPIFGINSYKLKNNQQSCMVKGENKPCSDLVDKTWFNEQFRSRCVGKNECMFHRDQMTLHMDKATNPALYKECINDNSLVFVQYSCTQDEGTQHKKWYELSIVACIYLMITVIFSMFIIYMKSLSKLNAIKYDISTVTASDFTIEMDISDEAYKHFLRNEYEPKGKFDYYSQGLYLKQYLKKKIEDILNRYDAMKNMDLKT